MNSEPYGLQFLFEGKKYIIIPAKIRRNQFKFKGIIQLPPWTTNQVFQILKKYCEDNLDLQITYRVDVLQKLLWLGDYLELEKFEQLVINRLIIPYISADNCLTFLTQAYKKLNTYQDDTLIAWYQMLNISMNITAKNIEIISGNQLDRNIVNNIELNKIDQKILQEIIERCFKSKKCKNQRYNIIKIMKNLKIYQFSTLIDILNQRKKIITEKRIYQQNSANIIKSINLKNQKKQKQTNPFSLSDYTWILITRKNESILKIFLKLLSRTNPTDQFDQNQITSVYFHSKIQNNPIQKHYSKANLVVGIQSLLFVTQFSITPFKNLNKDRLEFSMFISIDYTSSCILNFIADNWKKYLIVQLILKYSIQDLKSIFQSLRNRVGAQQMLQFIIDFSYDRHVENIMDLMKEINLKSIQISKLKNFLGQKKVKDNSVLKNIIEMEICNLDLKNVKSSKQNSAKKIGNQQYLSNTNYTDFDDHPLMNIQNYNNSKQKNSRYSRVSNKSEVLFNKSAKKTSEAYLNIIQKIDIRNFIRSRNPEMLTHFNFVDSLKKL